MKVALRVLWMGEDIKSAIEARRIHHQLSPDYAWFEEDFSDVCLNSSFIFFFNFKIEKS